MKGNLLHLFDILDDSAEVRVLFPTKSLVMNSFRFGEVGNPIFLGKSTYNSPNFDCKSLYKYQVKEKYKTIQNPVSHCKLMVFLRHGQVDDETVLYFGSHNLS